MFKDKKRSNRDAQDRQDKMRELRKIMALLFIPALVFGLAGFFSSPALGAEKTPYEISLERLHRMQKDPGWVKDEGVTQRVQRIFKRVARAARRDPSTVRVFVVKGRAVNAKSLAGGFVILYRGLYDLCESDDELAFILAHELAHQTAGHYDGMESSLAGFAAEFGLGRRLPEEISRQKELEADRMGVIYAAVAGYKAGAAFSILDRAVMNLDARHPGSKERKARIAERIRSALDKTDLFYAGLLLYHAGDLAASEGAFRGFLSVYQAPEVYNDLGAVFHARAGAEVFDSCRKGPPLFQSGPLLLGTTSAGTLTTQASAGGGCNRDAYKGWLRDALAQYRKALELDPGNTAALVNSGIALTDLGEYEMAVGFLKRALAHGGPRKEIHNDLGAAYLRMKEYEKAEKSLNQAGDFPGAWFNRGVLEGLRGTAREREFFAKFLREDRGNGNSLCRGYARKRVLGDAGTSQSLEMEAPLPSSVLEGLMRSMPEQTARKRLGKPGHRWILSVNPDMVMETFEGRGWWVIFEQGRVRHLVINKPLYGTRHGMAVGSDYRPLLKGAASVASYPARVYIREGDQVFAGDRSTGKIIRWMVY